jgi:hypothetical protein
MGVRVGSAGCQARFWELSDFQPAADLGSVQPFCMSEAIQPVRLLEIDFSAVAHRAMWGYGVGPPSDTVELPMVSRADVDLGPDEPLARLADEAQAESRVDDHPGR